jgi:hypothetical protein
MAACTVPVAAALVLAARSLPWKVGAEPTVVTPDVDGAVDALPLWLRRGIPAGVYGLGLLGAAASVLVIAMLLVRGDVVVALYGSLGVGVVGGIALTLGELLLAPNILLWALSVLAGPGFQVASGGSVTVTGSHPGLLPMVPVLGALPGDSAFPSVVGVLVLVPVVVGALVARRAQAPWSALGSWRGKWLSTGAAVVSTAVLVLALALLGVGAAGVDRLDRVGPSAWALAGALLGELAVGAVAYACGSAMLARLRR